LERCRMSSTGRRRSWSRPATVGIRLMEEQEWTIWQIFWTYTSLKKDFPPWEEESLSSSRDDPKWAMEYRWGTSKPASGKSRDCAYPESTWCQSPSKHPRKRTGNLTKRTAPDGNRVKETSCYMEGNTLTVRISAWRILILFLSSLLTSLLVSPLATAYAADRTLSVGVYQNEPLIFTNEQGQADGLYVDVLEEIADRLDLNLTYSKNTFSENLDLLEPSHSRHWSKRSALLWVSRPHHPALAFN